MAVNDIGKVMTAEEFAIIIENYKQANPLKYEAKKEALEAKLKALSPAKKTAKKAE